MSASDDPPARIDFHLLGPDQDVILLACKLAEKAVEAEHRVWMWCADAEQQEALDQRLWAFSATAFLPHGQWSAEAAEESELEPVWLGLTAVPNPEPRGPGFDVLLALGVQPSAVESGYRRVIHLITEPQRPAARDLWRHYQGLGVALHHFDHGREANRTA